jgi:hypothetical protein
MAAALPKRQLFGCFVLEKHALAELRVCPAFSFFGLRQALLISSTPK